jgi:hypothetical protein
MIKPSDLVPHNYYWYVFIPTYTAVQTIKLEKVFLVDLLQDKSATFRTVKFDKSDNMEFLTVYIDIPPANYNYLFKIQDKEIAEKLWAKEFFKNFESINGIDFSHFIELYKKIQIENPEWLI